MASNKGLGSGYVYDNPYAITNVQSVVTTPVGAFNPNNTFKYQELMSLNNFPLLQGYTLEDYTDDNGGTGDTGTGNGGGTTTPPGDPHNVNDLGDTFEIVYKNLASYPNTTEMTNKDDITRTYVTSVDATTGDPLTTIVVNTNTTVPNIIVTTLSGDIPDDIDNVRTITIGADLNTMEAVYAKQ